VRAHINEGVGKRFMRNCRVELGAVLTSIFILTGCGGGSSSNPVTPPVASVSPVVAPPITPPPPPVTETPPPVSDTPPPVTDLPPPENILEAVARITEAPETSTSNDLPVITLSGVAGKGVIDGARIVVADALMPLDDFIENGRLLGEGRTNGQGEFTISVQTTAETSEFLLVGALLGGANMICDAPSGCIGGAAFGEPAALGETSNGIWAMIPTPAPGDEATANLNLFTLLHLIRMLGLDSEFGDHEGESPITLELEAQHFEPAATYVANAFGLEQELFHTVPFVDVTQGISSTNANAVHMGYVAAGFLEASTQAELVTSGEDASINGVLLNGIVPFLLPDLLLKVNENDENQNDRIVSLEDIFDDALKTTELNPINNNALSWAVDWLEERRAAIDAVPHGGRLNADGTYPENSLPVLLNTTFEIVENDTDGIILNIEDPDSADQNFVVTIEEIGDYELFEIVSTNGLPTLRINQNIILDFEMADNFFDDPAGEHEISDNIFEITLNITDENGGTITEAISIELLNDDTEVGEENFNPPTLTRTHYTVTEGSEVIVILELDDPNNQSDTLIIDNRPTHDSQFFDEIFDEFIVSLGPLEFDNPQDENGDNIYELTVSLSDVFTGDFFEERDIQIEIIRADP